MALEAMILALEVMILILKAQVLTLKVISYLTLMVSNSAFLLAAAQRGGQEVSILLLCQVVPASLFPQHICVALGGHVVDQVLLRREPHLQDESGG